ncbi:hypothetical protein [Massilia sp. TSP1-1-2]|uniref:hypothetical protein n=1 Tax=Massilia sp. TSP1-1-2 TaxID=2804649 RepID=UPI003CEE71F2
MATITDESTKKDAAEFEAGYAEEQKRPEQTEEEAFGLDPKEVPAAGEPTGAAATVSIDMDKADADSAAADPAAEGAPADEAGAPAAEAAPALDVEKETQRLKSWEGRLKAQQAELDTKKAAGAAPGDADADPDADAPAAVDAAGEGDSAGEGGEGDDADLKALTEDFGAEFVDLLVKVITKIASKSAATVAGEHGAPYRKDIDAIIADINNEKQRAHFEKIADAHPDFNDVAGSGEFKAWVAGMDEADKAEAERVASAGTAKEIIALLKRYKATKASGDEDMDFAMDQAEGVRSTGGIKLPDSPTSSDDYEKAWNDN